MYDVADALLALVLGFNSRLCVEHKYLKGVRNENFRPTEIGEKYSFQVRISNLCLNYKVNEF
jgi:hypothetical protein